LEALKCSNLHRCGMMGGKISKFATPYHRTAHDSGIAHDSDIRVPSQNFFLKNSVKTLFDDFASFFEKKNYVECQQIFWI